MTEQKPARHERDSSQGQVEQAPRPRNEDATRPEAQKPARHERDSSRGQDVAAERPLLRVITPDTTPEEIAALVAVLSAMGRKAEPTKRRRTEWNSPYRQVRPFYSHGPGGWRSSGLPKHRGRGS